MPNDNQKIASKKFKWKNSKEKKLKKKLQIK